MESDAVSDQVAIIEELHAKGSREEILALGGVSCLKEKCRKLGVSQKDIDNADDETDVKETLAELLLKQYEVRKATLDAEKTLAKQLRTAAQETYATLKVSELKQKVLSNGGTQDMVDECDDQEDVKEALVSVLIDNLMTKSFQSEARSRLASQQRRQEYDGFKVSQLKRKAVEQGIARSEIEGMDDAPDVKTALIDALLQVSARITVPANIGRPPIHTGANASQDADDLESSKDNSHVAVMDLPSIIGSFAENKPAILKILHVPFGVSFLPSSYGRAGVFKLMDAVVSDGKKEYPLVVRGEDAEPVLEKLRVVNGQVVVGDKISHNHYMYEDQVKVPADVTFTVSQEHRSMLSEQKLNCVSLSALSDQKDKAKVSFARLVIHKESIKEVDKNGASYRVFRVVDEYGKAIWMKSWGDISADDSLYRELNIVRIQRAFLNKTDGRVDLRTSASIHIVGVMSAPQLPKSMTYVRI